MLKTFILGLCFFQLWIVAISLPFSDIKKYIDEPNQAVIDQTKSWLWYLFGNLCCHRIRQIYNLRILGFDLDYSHI